MLISYTLMINHFELYMSSENHQRDNASTYVTVVVFENFV